MGAFDDLSIPEPLDSTLPRWVTENAYPERRDEMLEDLYRVAYWQEVCQLTLEHGKHKPDSMTPPQWLDTVLTEFDGDGDRDLILTRIGSAAACKAAARADSLKGDFELVFYKALWKINVRKLWALSRYEYESFEEFLVDMVPRLKEAGNEGELSDVLFMMQHLLPIMQNVGGDFKPEKLMELPQHWARARRAVPYLRAKVRMVQDSSEEIDAGTEKGKQVLEAFHKAVDNVVKVIADPNIPRDGPTGVARTLFSMDEGGQLPGPVDGFLAFLTEGKNLYFFVVPGRWQRAIESSLSSTVKFESIDPEVGFQALDHLLHPKTLKGTSDRK